MGWIRVGATAVCVVAVVAACGSDDPDVEAAAEASLGASLFENNCAVCHGASGMGTNVGPPLVHDIYEPGHHPDETFQRAVAQGTPAHHWDFGDMPPVPGLEPDEVGEIIAYVRSLQRDAGIIR